MSYANTTGLRIYYERHGSGCPVLFIGGVGGDLRGEPGVLEEELATRFDLLTFDQRGTGQTDKPDSPYTMTHYARDAAAAAMGHNSLNSLYGGRFVLGIGVSHPPLVSNVRGQEYKKPMAAMRDYLDGMDQAWAAIGGAPAQKQVVLAALGPKMTQLAAERTLGAFPYNITPEQAGISRSNVSSDSVVICEQKVCLCTDPVQARAVARANLGFYLPLPNYFNNWFRLGFNEDDLADGGSDRLMDAMVFWGEADEIKAKLQGYFDGGADQVVIQPLRADGEPGPCWEALEAFAPGA